MAQDSFIAELSVSRDTGACGKCLWRSVSSCWERRNDKFNWDLEMSSGVSMRFNISFE